MNFDMNKFAARLRGRRAELDYTQSELADLASVSHDLIAKYENQAYVPGADKIARLADVLECTPNYLMGWTDR